MSTAKGPFDIFPKDLNERILNPTFDNPYGVGDWLIHQEDFFQPQDRFAFSPLPSYPASVEGLALMFMLKKLSETPQGMKSLERIIIKYLDTCGGIIENITAAAKAHPQTAVHFSVLGAGISHKLGLLSNGGYLKVIDQARNMITVFQQQATAGIVVEGLTTLVEGSKTSVTPTKYGVGRSASGLGLLANTKAIAP